MATAKKKQTKPKRAAVAKPRRPARKAPAPRAQARKTPPIAKSSALASLVAEPEPAIESAPDPELALATPEVLFAERVPPPELDRPYPAVRRAIFFDVENTSRAQHIARVIDHLQIDRRGHRTEFVAVGNWRVVGHDTARLLARHGADLVHSAPSVGVRDWSDLRIAVAAGAWLAGARPGDMIEIVSDDRAFDAVGDVAASLGIVFRRLSYRGLAGAPAEEMPAAAPEQGVAESRSSSGDRRGQRYRGRYHGRRDARPASSQPVSPSPNVSPPAHVPPPAPVPPPAHVSRPQPVSPPPIPAAPPRPISAVESIQQGEEPHTAPHDELLGVVRDLVAANPARGVSIDTVANALKSRGFSRPPGSPRLITRLRRIKEIELDRAGMITLVDTASRPDDAAPRSAAAASGSEDAAPQSEVDAPRSENVPPRPEEAAPPPQDAAPRVAAPIPREPSEIDDDEGPQPGNEKIETGQPAADDSQRRRWRRGGRHWRGGGRPQPSATS